MVSYAEQGQFHLKVISKTWSRDSHGLFDYEYQGINQQTHTIDGKASLYRASNELKVSKEASSSFTIEDRHLCSSIIGPNGNHTISNPVDAHMEPTEDNINELQNKIWYVIKNDMINPNTDSHNANVNHFPGNEPYPLIIGDIIKLGRVKYAIIEMKINNELKAIEKDDNLPVFNLVPNVKENKETENNKDIACKICYSNDIDDSSNKLINLCKCTGTISKVHFFCLKKWMETKLSIKENNQKNVTSYLIKSFNCEICKKPYPLRFILNEKLYSFVDYPRPINDNSYIVLESLNQIKENMNIKSVQVISLSTDTNITIGRGNEADVRVNDISVSRKHAAIVLKNNAVYLIDHSSKFGTLVLIKQQIEVPKMKELTVQIGRTLLICTKVSSILNCNSMVLTEGHAQSNDTIVKRKPVFLERVEDKQQNDEESSQKSQVNNQGQRNALLSDVEMNDENVNNIKLQTTNRDGSVNNQNSDEENLS